jgi:hypothetical protein
MREATVEYGAVRADGLGIDRPEHVWYKATRAQLEALRAWLDDRGYTPSQANGLIGALAMRDFESMSKRTRTTYRAALREFGPPNGRGPRAQKRGLRSADNPRGVRALVAA